MLKSYFHFNSLLSPYLTNFGDYALSNAKTQTLTEVFFFQARVVYFANAWALTIVFHFMTFNFTNGPYLAISQIRRNSNPLKFSTSMVRT